MHTENTMDSGTLNYIVQPLVSFIREQLKKQAEHLKSFRQIGPWSIELMNSNHEMVCEMVFWVQYQRGEASIALDGINVAPKFRRQGVCTAILKALTHELREDSPFSIRAVVLNPVSNEMKACLCKLGVIMGKDSLFHVRDLHFRS